MTVLLCLGEALARQRLELILISEDPVLPPNAKERNFFLIRFDLAIFLRLSEGFLIEFSICFDLFLDRCAIYLKRLIVSI